MNFSEQLKSQLNIADVVSHYVRLKRQGSGPRYVGLCPFHSEKTPSFSVNSALGFFKCFGCDAGGDVFKFVQDIESLTFPETLKLLAERFNIPLPERQRWDDPAVKRRAALLEMHEIAAELFQNNLRGSSGAEARQYLESRGVSRAATDEFRLGLSDSSWDQLTQRLQRFGSELLEQSGLVTKRQSSGFYDTFRGRLMFPIQDESGKVIAFGGRALQSGEERKYINSPATKLYNKSAVLYNLHRAKSDARKNDRMILVEGYLDVIAVYSAGVHEVVAASGTAFRMEQVRAIKRQIAEQQAISGQIVLNFDSDSAGVRSTEKYIAMLLAEGLRVKVLEIPGGLDPDEYIQQNGAGSYRKLLDHAPSYFHWLADQARNKFDMRSAEGRMDAYRFLMPSIQQVSDRIERSAIAREMAEYLKVDRDTFVQNFRGPSAKAPAERPARDAIPALPLNEKLLLACFIHSPQARTTIRYYLGERDLLHLLEAGHVFETVLALDDNLPFSLDAILSGLDPPMQRLVSELSFANLRMTEEDATQQALYCLRELDRRAADVHSQALRRRVREMEQQGDLEEALRLAEELNRLSRANSEA